MLSEQGPQRPSQPRQPAVLVLNPSFAIGIGLLYWLVTWQFLNLVSQYNISAGKIDGLGLTASLRDVLPYLPLYLVSAELRGGEAGLRLHPASCR